MNTGQSIFSIGSLLLFSITTLQVNDKILSNDVVLQESKFSILAHSLAASTIEEASNKAFDAVTATDGVTDVNLLTSPYSLGPGDGELPGYFNDFDDYNGLVRHITNIPSAEFDITCKVQYVTPQNIQGYILQRTWHKKITVDVSSPFMQDTIHVSKVFSYWNFR
jgi:hypothetical protein